MEKNTTAQTSGITFTGLLQITFIVLKLLNKITWSWFWVLSPTWIGILLVILAIIIFILAIRKS